MPRAPRLHAPNLLYHVYARGNNRNLIFFEENDYQRFLNNLDRFSSPFHLKILTYCLLPNHFHLLLKIGDIELSKFMQVLLTAYTMYVNKKRGRVGHIFQGRYQSIVVEKETYLLQVQRYIHRNPVKAGISASPESYPWSGYTQYLNLTSKPPKLEKPEILGLFSENPEMQIALFQQFTETETIDDFDPFKASSRGVLGSSKFHQKLTRVLRGVRP
ncbi:MAG: transposase [bacterium]|nr:transposase [bacterium]